MADHRLSARAESDLAGIADYTIKTFGIGASGHGRDYRLGYGLTVAQDGAMHFELGIDANRRESPSQGTAEHGVLGRLTARW